MHDIGPNNASLFILVGTRTIYIGCPHSSEHACAKNIPWLCSNYIGFDNE